MLEAWVVKVELQWHTETDGVGIAALHCSLQLSACCVHAACYQLWSALQLLVYVPTSCRLQGAEYGQLHCRVHAALTAALKRGGLGWAGD